MFEPYLKSFYIRSTDPTQIKVLKVLSLYPHVHLIFCDCINVNTTTFSVAIAQALAQLPAINNAIKKD